MAYNVPSVTLDAAKRLAIVYMKSGIIPFLVSAPGVGKTMTALAVAKAMGAKFRSIRLNNIAPEEVSGLQYIDRQGQHSTHLPPKWMPASDGSDGPVVVFIDEITQASDENRKAIMSALLERYLGDTEIPDNCYFMAAGNSSEDGTNVYEFDRATADRFGVIRVRTDVETWCNDYAPTIDCELSVVALLRLRPDVFEMSAELSKGDDVIGPSPRTWAAVSRFVKTAREEGMSEEETIIGVMGKVGQGVGEAYKVIKDQVDQMKTIAELLNMPREKRREHAPRNLDALWTYSQGMIWHATTADRMVQVFDLLDSFEEIEDVPFYEMRFNVAETMYQRAIAVHNIPEITDDPRLGELIVKWKRELADSVNGVPDMGRDPQVAMKVAA